MPTKVGFIGVGLIATSHLENLSAMDGVEIAALCDVSPAALEKAQQRFGGRTYSDHRQMLDDQKLDAVYVCIPPFAHSGQELDVLASGAALFVEKPVTLDLELGRKVAQEIERRGAVACCGYHWRYADTTRRVRELLPASEIAQVLGRWLGGIWMALWWKVKELSGGQIVEQVTHLFDLSRYLVGDITEVTAFAAGGHVHDVEGYTLDDASVANVRFATGAVGNFSQTCILDRGLGSDLTLIGRNRAALFSTSSLRVTEPDRITEYPARDPALKLEDEAFIRAVRAGDPSGLLSTYADALQTVTTTLAAEASLQQGGRLQKVGRWSFEAA
jgi:predicted dehydrogenase